MLIELSPESVKHQNLQYVSIPWAFSHRIMKKGSHKVALWRVVRLHDCKRSICSRYDEILLVLFLGNFWRELDRHERRHVFDGLPLRFAVRPWGRQEIKTKLMLTVPFWHCLWNHGACDAQALALGPECWDPESSNMMYKARECWWRWVCKHVFWRCAREVPKTRF